MNSDILEGRSLQRIVGLIAIILFVFAAIWTLVDTSISLVLGSLAVVLALLAPAGKEARKKTTKTEKSEKKEPAPKKEESSEVEEYVPEVEEPGANLKDLPIETIEGIGEIFGEKLRKTGIDSVQDLVDSTPDKVAEICDVEVARARRWMTMGRFTRLDSVSEEDAEALVVAAGITELKSLANADAKDLLSKIQMAVDSGDVQVPAGYEFTLDMVEKWIRETRELLYNDSA
ncbi:MAG: DUF4332 domain-containing protein [Candidatus Thorarchaeota archaeon]